MLVGDTVTLDVVVQGASEGIIAYEFDLLLGDTSVGTVTGFNERRGLQRSEIIGDGEGVHFETALLDETYDGADEITIGTVTLGGAAVGEADITFAEIIVQNNNSNTYETATDPGTLTVGTPDDDTDNGSDDSTDNGSDDSTDNGSDNGSDDSTDSGSDTGAENASDDGSGDGLGPGFGPVSALSGLGGAVYLLRRRLLDGDKEE